MLVYDIHQPWITALCLLNLLCCISWFVLFTLMILMVICVPASDGLKPALYLENNKTFRSVFPRKNAWLHCLNISMQLEIKTSRHLVASLSNYYDDQLTPKKSVATQFHDPVTAKRR
jgi:hypothetical protein